MEIKNKLTVNRGTGGLLAKKEKGQVKEWIKDPRTETMEGVD